MEKNPSPEAVKRLMCEIGRRLWRRGFVAGRDGNLSYKFAEETIYITAAGVSKGFMGEAMILCVDEEGNPVGPSSPYRPTSEIRMHLAVYQTRPDVRAVVHAHPPFATALAVSGKDLDCPFLAELLLTLGTVPLVPYATPSTDEVPQVILPYLHGHDALLLAHHGALTVGPNLEAAYGHMETLEHAAQIYHHACALGGPHSLTPAEAERLISLAAKPLKP